jgi:hypothetical protein
VVHVQYDLFLTRVLRCFEGHRYKHAALSLKEVTDRYNELYPPSFVGKLLRRSVTEAAVQTALTAHVRFGHLEAELFSFTDQPHPVPLRRYVLTPLGVQKLHRGEGKKKR